MYMHACVYMKLPSIVLFRLYSFRSLLRCYYSGLPALFIVFPHRKLFSKILHFLRHHKRHAGTHFEPHSILTYTHMMTVSYPRRGYGTLPW